MSAKQIEKEINRIAVVPKMVPKELFLSTTLKSHTHAKGEDTTFLATVKQRFVALVSTISEILPFCEVFRLVKDETK